MASGNIDGSAANGAGDASIYNTKVPGYEDSADIQAALRVYHYGTTSVPENPESISSQSVAGYLKSLQDDIDVLDARGIGSVYDATEPTSPINGLIWVDADAAIASQVLVPTALYQDAQPTGTIAEGTLWVDKDSSPLSMYVYDATLGWRGIGS